METDTFHQKIGEFVLSFFVCSSYSLSLLFPKVDMDGQPCSRNKQDEFTVKLSRSHCKVQWDWNVSQICDSMDSLSLFVSNQMRMPWFVTAWWQFEDHLSRRWKNTFVSCIGFPTSVFSFIKCLTNTYGRKWQE